MQMDKPETYRGAVYPWHCDHIGRMNVMWYVGKFDEGTWNFLALLGYSGARMRDEEKGWAAVQQNITYKRELMSGDTVVVRTELREVRDKVIRFVHEMIHGDSGELAALCELTAVHMDRKERRSAKLPPDVLAKARAMLAPAAQAS
jgi:acyl-CoA thioester hydrolase